MNVPVPANQPQWQPFNLNDELIEAHIPQFAFAFLAKSLRERIYNVELIHNPTI